jgi:hypothetical protein
MTNVMEVESNARSTIVLAHTGQARPGGEVPRRMGAIALKLVDTAEEVAHFRYEAHLGNRLWIARPHEHIPDVADLTFGFLPGKRF